MKPTMLLILALMLSSSGINAQKLTVINKTDRIIDVMLIPQGIMQLSKRKKKLALKHRFARIKPGRSARLKVDNLESIDVKVWSELKKSIHWYKYDNIHAHQLLNEIKSYRHSMKISIIGGGDKYKAELGKQVIDGELSQFSRIFR